MLQTRPAMATTQERFFAAEGGSGIGTVRRCTRTTDEATQSGGTPGVSSTARIAACRSPMENGFTK